MKRDKHWFSHPHYRLTLGSLLNYTTRYYTTVLKIDYDNTLFRVIVIKELTTRF